MKILEFTCFAFLREVRLAEIKQSLGGRFFEVSKGKFRRILEFRRLAFLRSGGTFVENPVFWGLRGSVSVRHCCFAIFFALTWDLGKKHAFCAFPIKYKGIKGVCVACLLGPFL